MILHGSMVSWQGTLCHGYMCILLYVRLMGCNGVAWISGQLAEGSICHGYMCIMLYMKLTGCNGFAWIYGQLPGGSISHGHMYILLYMKVIGCNSLHGSMVNWQRGPSAMGTFAFCYI